MFIFKMLSSFHLINAQYSVNNKMCFELNHVNVTFQQKM